MVDAFDAYKDGTIRWFASPPVDVVSMNSATHSLQYLLWKTKQAPEIEMQDSSKVVEKTAKPRAAISEKKLGKVEDLAKALKAISEALEKDAVKILEAL